MPKLLTIDDIDVNQKTVFVRVDINAPVDENTKKLMKSERIEAHAKTIKELSDKGAKVVVLAHQGRPCLYDFLPLSQHAVELEKYIQKPVKYIDDIFGSAARNAILSLNAGDILLLENVRFFSEEEKERSAEEQSKSIMIDKLAPLADFFVNDAFSAAHRGHVSMIGFAPRIKTVAGRVMEHELKSLEKAMENPKRPSAYVLGGAKPDDSLKVMAHSLKNNTLDYALVCGVVGQLFLIADGIDLGTETMKYMQKKEHMKFLEKAKELLKDYKDKIIMPLDLAVEKNKQRVEIDVKDLPSEYSTMDIGKKTVDAFLGIIKGAKSIMVNGPAGVYELSAFEYGTKELLNAVAESDAFSLLGGGHTISAIDKFKIDTSKFSYISLAGGALITYLTGKTFPIVEEFKKYA